MPNSRPGPLNPNWQGGKTYHPGKRSCRRCLAAGARIRRAKKKEMTQ